MKYPSKLTYSLIDSTGSAEKYLFYELNTSAIQFLNL